MVDAIRQIGVSEVTYYRWRQEFGGLKTEQVKRLKDLELENSRLRKAVSDLTLDKLILQEAGETSKPRASPTLIVGCRNPQRQMATRPKGQQFQWLSSGESSLGSKPE
jgi:hypothetical protein